MHVKIIKRIGRDFAEDLRVSYHRIPCGVHVSYLFFTRSIIVGN